ncbi:VOC family protein [Pseudobdellovibrio sp. HCB154]|uniref:VOC family protein n=1 Tax=Pseudobdellovibrio sp. HCB154 TaxID=3386277 RepID=UPI003916DA3C
MIFQIKNFSTLRIFSHDLRKSRDWYIQFLGQLPIEDLENFVSFQIGNTKLDITVPDQKNPFSTGGSIGYWLVDDVNLVLKKTEQLGGKLYRGPLKVPEIQRQILQIQDPFGNVLGFESAI